MSDKVQSKLRAKLYAKARDYWKQAGDHERLTLTDEQLDEQFWLFDHEGIPRLKSDQDKVELPRNSLARLGQLAPHKTGSVNEVDIARHADDILRGEFGSSDE